ncbi:MAG: hypothetical protein AABX65_04675 [Nanoarchaeota archaeon]
MKYLFILGRNPELSRQEILSWLEARGVNVLSQFISNEKFILDLSEEINPAELIGWLGGCLKIGKVILSEINVSNLINKLDKINIYLGEEEKFFYSIIENTESELADYLKQRFKREKLKAVLKNVGRQVRLQDGSFGSVSPSSAKRLGVEYFLVSSGKEYNFGMINAYADNEENEEIDMSKPERRSELGISPRLAKILVNLSCVKAEEELLDPFCGIGGVLCEAMLNNVNVSGIDADKIVAESARKNLQWVKNKYNSKASVEVLAGDSRTVILKYEVDAIACEPQLGPLLKSVPRKDEAEKIVREFENLTGEVFRNIRKNLKKGGKIAFTMPFISSSGGKVKCDAGKIASLAGLKVRKGFPVLETREGKIVSREFMVLKNEN